MVSFFLTTAQILIIEPRHQKILFCKTFVILQEIQYTHCHKKLADKLLFYYEKFNFTLTSKTGVITLKNWKNIFGVSIVEKM